MDQRQYCKTCCGYLFLVLIVSSYATEIEFLFGALMAETIMPDVPKFRTIFIEK
jgi:hypothetical protein